MALQDVREPALCAALRHPEVVLDTEAAWELLVQECPGFAGSPEARDVDNEEGKYIWVAALARYLVRALGSGHTGELAAACRAIETILAEGDQAARNFANAGFIEDITNGHLFTGDPGREDLLPFFGSLARQNPWVMNIEHGYPS